jgi:hypothetical protein
MYEGKLKIKKHAEKFISNTNFNWRHYAPRRRTFKEDNDKVKYDYQVECYADGTPAKDKDYNILKKTEKQRFHNTELKVS